ncbi:MAG: copper chaperone PCu(A)C [Alphaproteobacteria bacterium]
MNMLSARLLSAIAGIACMALSGTASAGNVTAGDLVIGPSWARATPGAAANGAAFLTIADKGKTADKLIRAASPVAGTVELHTHVHEGGVMKMRPVPGIDIAPGATVEMKPGGLHVMLIGLKAPLKEGETFPLALTFEKAGEVRVEVMVKGIGEGAHDMNRHGEHGK